MNDQACSRNVIAQYGDGFPEEGIYCPKCKTYIPAFEDMIEEPMSKNTYAHKE
jgi:hypothetical protein